MKKTIFILGGYGSTGRAVCRRLLQNTDANIVIAGRDVARAKTVALELKKTYLPERIHTAQADAAKCAELVESIKNIDLLLVASNTPQYAKNVAAAAIEAGVDYLDYHFNHNVPGELQKLDSEAKKRNRVIITQAGFHPGLPATFVRYGAKFFDTYESALIGMIMNSPIENSDSILELVDELQEPSGELFENGSWRKAKFRDTHIFDFGRFGKKQCVPLKMVEMHILPSMFPLKKIGTFVAGFNWCTDYFIFPLAFIIGKIFPKRSRNFLAKLLTWGINTFSSKIPGVVFVLEAKGKCEKEGKTLRLVADHQDAYDFTAISVVACIKQYLDGKIISPGVHMMAAAVDPEEIIKDLQEMSVTISQSLRPNGE
ncbi:hypothetical protein COV82_02410 [Candidatus Peregrinibacteria bacterium CG11_big_fil_rev_8_21_14_0_20_46_8]|nr:MAG: hypothetical protein COV82_02410 [Candidatus Peregrinibacteria bacterium CG11_big_fil_rev_8_21_14_0_20_46_8]